MNPHYVSAPTYIHSICISMIHTYTDKHQGRKKNLNMLWCSIKTAFLLFLTICHDTKMSLFCIKMTISGDPSMTVFHFGWPQRRHRGRGLHSPDSPLGCQLVLGWLGKMPSGSCGERSGSWQCQSWRKLKEEETWKGKVRRKSLQAPSVPPCLSHLVPETREQLLVFISFLLLKNGFLCYWQMRAER